MPEHNPFQRLNLETVPYARRRKIEKQKLVPKTGIEKANAEKDKLWNLYVDELDKRKKKLTSGPYAATAEGLFAFLKTMTLESGEQLIQMAEVWRAADRDTRYLVLQSISTAMIHVRESNGMSPFDDPLWDEEPNAFMIIRKILT